jgi:hypothetical protein
MIDPAYLATLRSSQVRPELVLTLVQLDAIAPGWWDSHQTLAGELGLTTCTFSYNLNALARKGLVAHKTFLNGGGTFIWWVKRSQADTPDPAATPAYVVRDLSRRLHERIPVNGIREWAKRRGIHQKTLWHLLSGRQRTLRYRWELVSSPYDLEELAA